ncbi:hypothetical protein ACFX4N_24150 [Priestia sp. YIM B13551]|uniref:hypothetical protein n=1 Tax=Priestia sp. YIM B13551 TaxID=3366306 RepID=UPI00366BB814
MQTMLSTGEPSTLGNWYKLCKGIFGEESKATLFIKEKMDEEGEGANVVAEESQLLTILGKMHLNEQE